MKLSDFEGQQNIEARGFTVTFDQVKHLWIVEIDHGIKMAIHEGELTLKAVQDMIYALEELGEVPSYKFYTFIAYGSKHRVIYKNDLFTLEDM